jgi:hypothetical protein
MMDLETETDTETDSEPASATDAEPAEASSDAEAGDEESRYDTSSLGPVVGPIESDLFAGFRGGVSRFNYAIWTGYAVTALIAGSLFIGSRTLPAKRAILIVTTTPPDVTLKVDGKPIEGRSPFRLDDLIPEDDHVIEVERSGFTAAARRVSLAPGEIRTLREVALVPIAATPPVSSARLDAEDPP